MPLVREPPVAPLKILTLSILRRHNSLQPALQPTNRILLRWAEGMGDGLPNPDAEIRETHYDTLPPDVKEKVDGIVFGSPWEMLTRKWYRTSLSIKGLADALHVSRSQIYVDWQSSLWYYRGRFENERIYG